MKLYNSVGPNPRMVRMFMAEKGFDVPKVEIDLRGEIGQDRSNDKHRKNREITWYLNMLFFVI